MTNDKDIKNHISRNIEKTPKTKERQKHKKTTKKKLKNTGTTHA